MSVRTETLQLRVVVDGSPARRELATLDQEYAKINSELRDLKKNTEAYTTATNRLGEIRQRQEELRKEIGITSLTAKQLTDELKRLQVAQRNLTPNTQVWAENAARIEQVKNRLRELNDVNARAQAAWNGQRGAITLTRMSMRELEMEATRLRAALHNMRPDSIGFRNLQQELLGVEQRMKTLQTGMGPFGRMWQGVKGQLAGAGAVLGTFLVATGIINGIKNWVESAAKLSDAQADVQRTTGMTRAEINGLTRDLSRLNTRTPRTELLALAADAGKLGISARTDVLAFVKAGDQIRVALGDDLGEEAIKSIGKLNQTFKVGEATGKGLEAQMLATGSAINALGQSSTAQEAYLVDFATRMAGVNTQAKINVQDTLGYAAALDQLGQRSETASTALSQFTLKAFKNTAEYAKIAGMNIEEFSTLLNTNANEALLRVLEGLNGNNEGLSRMTALFSDMGQEGARAVSTLASLASNTKLVREQQAIANKEFAAGTSITNEFNTKNNTLAANLEIIGKRLAGAFVSSGVVDAINGVARGLANWLRQPVDAELQKQRNSVNALVFETMRLKEGDEQRIANIQRLKKEYPQYAAFLEAERATNADLAVVLDKVNAAYVKKILLAHAQEDIADIQDRQAEAIEDEGAAMDRMNALRGAAMLQMNTDQKQRFAESYEMIAGYFQKVQNAERSEVSRNIRFNQWMQNNGMPATLYDEMQKLVRAEAMYKGALDRRLSIDEEFQQKMARINRLASMLGEAEDLPASERPSGASVVPEISDKDKEKLNQQLDQWRQELTDFRERIYQDGLSDDERDIRQLDVKHAAELAKLKANKLTTAADLKALDEAQERERAELIEAQGEERVKGYSAAAERIRRSMLDSATLHLEDEAKKWDDLIALAKKYGIDTAELERKREEMLEKIRQEGRKKAQESEEKADADALAARKKRLQHLIGEMQAYGQLAGSIVGMIEAVKAAEEGRADADGARSAEEEERIARLERQRVVAAMVTIAVSSATGVAQAISAGAGVPFPGNLGAIASGVAAVLSGIAQAYTLLNSARQQSSLQQQPSSPALQNAPLGAKGMVLDGPSHDNDGLKVYDPQRQRVVAELEGGELVLSKLFTANNRALVPMLLQLSATGGRLPIGRSGGIFGKVAPFNFGAANEAVRYAAGGVLGHTYTFSKSTGMAPQGSGGHYTFSKSTGLRAEDDGGGQVLNLLKQIAAATTAFPTRVRGDWSSRDLERRQQRDAQLQGVARVKRLK